MITTAAINNNSNNTPQWEETLTIWAAWGESCVDSYDNNSNNEQQQQQHPAVGGNVDHLGGLGRQL